MRACVAPVCNFKSEVEVVTHNGRLKACCGSVNEVTFRKYKKNIMVEMWYGITFSAVQEFVMIWDNFIGIAI